MLNLGGGSLPPRFFVISMSTTAVGPWGMGEAAARVGPIMGFVCTFIQVHFTPPNNHRAFWRTNRGPPARTSPPPGGDRGSQPSPRRAPGSGFVPRPPWVRVFLWFFPCFRDCFSVYFTRKKIRPGQFLSRVILFFAPPGFFRTNFGPGTPSARKKIRACCGKFHPVGHVFPDFFVWPGKCKAPRAKMFPLINVPTPQAPGEGIACLAVDLHRKNEPE